MPKTDATTHAGSTPASPASADQLRAVEMLAGLLEHMERQSQPDPDQYRLVVSRLSSALKAAAMDDPLRAILKARPAAAEVYENLNYGHAGLCLHQLDRATAGEQAARRVLTKARMP